MRSGDRILTPLLPWNDLPVLDQFPIRFACSRWQRREPHDIDSGLIRTLRRGHIRKPWARGICIYQTRADRIDQDIPLLGFSSNQASPPLQLDLPPPTAHTYP